MTLSVDLKVNERVTIHAEGETTKEIFRNLAKLQEAFGRLTAVKTINGVKEYDKYTEFRVRKVEDTEFFELYSRKLKAKLPYGVGKDHEVYPKRAETDDKGKTVKVEGKTKYLADDGWRRWNPETQKEE